MGSELGQLVEEQDPGVPQCSRMYPRPIPGRRIEIEAPEPGEDAAWQPPVDYLALRGIDRTRITQQARNLAVGERLRSVRFLIRDRDSKFSDPLDRVFRCEGVKVVGTPFRAPRANAFAERWVRTVRTECLDWMLVFGRPPPRTGASDYTAYYNEARPHRGLDLNTPKPRPDPLAHLLDRRPGDGDCPEHVRVRS